MPPSGVTLPVPIPGKTVQVAYAPNATPDWQDVLLLQEDGNVYHVWYRTGAGWQGPEHISSPS